MRQNSQGRATQGHMRAQDAAREAARRAGMSLDEWMDSLDEERVGEDPPMRQQNRRQARVAAYDEHDDGAYDYTPSARSPYDAQPRPSAHRAPPRRDPLPQPRQPARSTNIEALQDQYHSLETLVNRMMTTAAPEVESHTRHRRSHLSDLSQRMAYGDDDDGLMDYDPPSQRLVPPPAANGRYHAPPPPPGFREPRHAAPPPTRGRTHDDEGGRGGGDYPPHDGRRDPLLTEIRNIATSMQALRAEMGGSRARERETHALATVRADLADMIGSLRTDVRNVSGKDMREAIKSLREDIAAVVDEFNNAQSHQSFERLNSAISAMAGQVSDLRRFSDGGQVAIQLESYLTRMRDEAQQAYQRHAAGIEDKLSALTSRIDRSAMNQLDGIQLERLQVQLEDIRKSLGTVDFKPAFDLLAREMRVLSQRIETMPASGGLAGPALEKISARLDELARRIDLRPPMQRQIDDLTTSRLEEAMAALARKIEVAQVPNARPEHISHLEKAIDDLASRLDRTGDTAQRLSTIERSLADLFVQIEDTRLTTLEGHGENNDRAAQVVSDLRARVTQLQARAEASDERNQAMLASLGNSLQWVVERLGSGEVPKTAAEEAPRSLVQTITDTLRQPEPAPPPPPSASDTRSLLPERPEATVQPARQQPATAPSSSERADFLAAARRAAQAAVEQSQTPQKPRAQLRPVEEPLELELADMQRAPDKAKKNPVVRTSVLVGVGVLLLLAAALQIGVQTLRRGGNTAPTASQAALPSTSSKTFNRAPTQAEVPPSAETTQTATVAPQPEAPVALAPPPAVASPLPPQQPANAGDVTGTATPRNLITSTPGTNLSSGWSLVDANASAKMPKRLLSAAENGDATAAYDIGMRYLEGRGVTADAPQAVRWLQRAADKGLAPAQWHMGSMLEKGTGIGRNVEEAIRYYKAAADQGNAKAMYNLAVLYASASGNAKPDYTASATYFRQAADYGLADAQYNLGILYARGLGVPQSMLESYKWFAIAANGGDADAARKRDDMARRLNETDLARAKQMVAAFSPRSEPEAAIRVGQPAEGWDDTPVPAVNPVKTRTVKTPSNG